MDNEGQIKNIGEGTGAIITIKEAVKGSCKNVECTSFSSMECCIRKVHVKFSNHQELETTLCSDCRASKGVLLITI